MSDMSELPSKIYKHKAVSIAVFLVVAIFAYFGYKHFSSENGVTKYALAMVEKGTITVSVSGSGQVSSSNQIDIKSKTSGDILDVRVVEGQEMKEGDILLQIDSKDAKKVVRDAQLAYDIVKTELAELSNPADEIDILKAKNAVAIAKINLEEMTGPVDEFTLLQYQNNLDDAKKNLEDVKINYKKEHQDALNAEQDAEEDLEKAYEDAYDSVANIFLELPEIMTKLREIFYSYEIADSDRAVPLYAMNKTVLLNSVFKDDRNKLEDFNKIGTNDYEDAKLKFDKNLSDYKSISRLSESEIIEELLDETSETMKAVSKTVKSEMNAIDFWVDCRSKDEQKIFKKVDDYKLDLKNQTSKTANYLSNIFSTQRSIKNSEKKLVDAKQNIVDLENDYPIEIKKAEWNVREKEEALNEIIDGPSENEIESVRITLKEKEEAFNNLLLGVDSLDLRSKRNSVQQKADTLADAREELSNCSVRAPFDGIVANIEVKKGDTVSSNSALATFVSNQKIAEISLNEIDVAKVKVGQKAIINFDAVEDLDITGEIVEVDTMGNSSQGVVSYGIKIAFDLEDERVKSGMSLTVSIITDVKQNVLMISNSAIKTSGEISYIEIPSEEISSELTASLGSGVVLKNNPRQQQIGIGIANDTWTEIITGIEEGEYAIIRIIASSTSQTTQQTQGQSLFGNTGGNFRMMR
ncbi:HlyD family efflux transporter periplasmic adaptor subunit [bacterium]|nr:MAG: HlyD family efflux transporter periplasmic adaptor subunit [bacterium]